jgi:hypothetical protein
LVPALRAPSLLEFPEQSPSRQVLSLLAPFEKARKLLNSVGAANAALYDHW